MNEPIKWKNGKPINWNSQNLRLSKMIPNGCDTTSRGQLNEIEKAVDAVLAPYYGKRFTKKAPIGALIIDRCLWFVEMYSSAYCYGSRFDKGEKYYEGHLRDLMDYGRLTRKVAEKECQKLLAIFKAYYSKHAKITHNAGTDAEGCIYNSMECDKEKLNITLDKKFLDS